VGGVACMWVCVYMCVCVCVCVCGACMHIYTYECVGGGEWTVITSSIYFLGLDLYHAVLRHHCVLSQTWALYKPHISLNQQKVIWKVISKKRSHEGSCRRSHQRKVTLEVLHLTSKVTWGAIQVMQVTSKKCHMRGHAEGHFQKVRWKVIQDSRLWPEPGPFRHRPRQSRLGCGVWMPASATPLPRSCYACSSLPVACWSWRHAPRHPQNPQSLCCPWNPPGEHYRKIFILFIFII